MEGIYYAGEFSVPPPKDSKLKSSLQRSEQGLGPVEGA